MVPARSMIKVLMIVKGGPTEPTPIIFKSEDIETESRLEINEKLTPISVTPSEMSDVVTQFNITAPGKFSGVTMSYESRSYDHN